MKTLLSLLFVFVFVSSQVLLAQNSVVERHESVGDIEFKEALKTEEYILLDVRTVEEYLLNNLERSKLVEFNGGNMDGTLSSMPKGHKYLVYSNEGVRSKVALKRMKELGFSHVLELDKGIKEWK
ncbi:rhodanese-like domain-containing protein [Brumimicrobium mesophilum]|uniref:rhodanese-like domain-containing protein n=1 Tax=Brumimicrobium mesophilum TaxID=392717 RepID=UPI000D13FB5F|nr:rhodanese-like domain-containing protein [Brumimicrobium mesophilum]